MAQPIDRTFLNHYILFPKEAPTKSSQDNNLIASIFLGIFTFGIVHALCGLAYLCRKKPAPVTDPLSPTQAKTGAQFAKTSAPTTAINAKAPVLTAPAAPRAAPYIREIDILMDGNCAFRAMAIGLADQNGARITDQIRAITERMRNRAGFNDNGNVAFYQIRDKFLKASEQLIQMGVNTTNPLEAAQGSFDPFVAFLRCCTSIDQALKVQSKALSDSERAAFYGEVPSLDNNDILTFLNNKCALSCKNIYYGDIRDACIVSRLFDTPMAWQAPGAGTPQFTMAAEEYHIILRNSPGHVDLSVYRKN